MGTVRVNKILETRFHSFGVKYFGLSKARVTYEKVILYLEFLFHYFLCRRLFCRYFKKP